MKMRRSFWDYIKPEAMAFFVVDKSGLPLIAPAEVVEQEDYAERQGLDEGLMLVFTTPDGANSYREYLVETDERRPSEVSVAMMTFLELFAIVEKMQNQNKPFRVEAYHQQNGYADVEIIFSPVILLN